MTHYSPIKGLNPQVRGLALTIARQWEIVSPNPTQPHMIRMPHPPHQHIILMSSWATPAARHKSRRKVCSSVICRAIFTSFCATPAARHKSHRKVCSSAIWCAIWATSMGAARRKSHRKVCSSAIRWAIWSTCKCSREALPKFLTRPQIYTFLRHMHMRLVHVPPWPPPTETICVARCHEPPVITTCMPGNDCANVLTPPPLQLRLEGVFAISHINKKNPEATFVTTGDAAP